MTASPSRWQDRFEQGSVPQQLNDARALRIGQQSHPIPDNAVPFFANNPGSVATPAWGSANQVVLATYQCPVGWEGLLTWTMNTITGDGGAFIQGSGDVVWTLDIDNPLANPLVSAHFLPGYGALITTMGDLTEPWPVARGWRMKSGETYRLKVYTVGIVPIGSPCFCHGWFGGISWPNC